MEVVDCRLIMPTGIDSFRWLSNKRVLGSPLLYSRSCSFFVSDTSNVIACHVLYSPVNGNDLSDSRNLKLSLITTRCYLISPSFVQINLHLKLILQHRMDQKASDKPSDATDGRYVGYWFQESTMCTPITRSLISRSFFGPSSSIKRGSISFRIQAGDKRS